MNGSDTYQRNERNRREFNKIRASGNTEASASGNPPGLINFPFLVGMGLGLGLNIIGYFAFKAYFRSFLQSVTSFRGSGIRRSGFEANFHQPRQTYTTHHQRKHSSQSHQYNRRDTKNQRNSSSNNKSADRIQDSARISSIKKHLLWLDMPLTKLNPSVADIKSAYRRISLQTHPDVIQSHGAGSGNEGRVKELEEKFMQATVAYDELSKSLHGK
jgi:curved DNA-binding protein CbpA